MNATAHPGKPPLDLCEEAVHLIRQAPVAAIAVYYLGGVPFILALLFFWADMASNANARDHVAGAALGLAILYLWMLTCQGMFAHRLRSQLAPTGRDAPSGSQWLRTAALQTALQPSKLFILPLALLLTMPFPVVFAFYHSASSARSFGSARRLAALWPHQNFVFLGITALLSVVVFANIGLTFLMLPYLLKMLLGVETVFTRSPRTFLNTTFLASVTALSYLALNPFVKAFYVLRCFYGDSVTTGEDLRAELKAGTVLSVCVLGLLLSEALPAQQRELPEQLNASIDRVLEHPEYAWRLPRAPRADHQEHNWFVRSTLAFLDATGRGLKQAGLWVDQLVEWLGDRFATRLPPLRDGTNARAPATELRLIVLLLLAVGTALAMYLLWRVLTSRKAQTAARIDLPPAAIDLNRDDLHAGQQAPEQWLELARGCMEKQEFRLALRALYLAGLSLLAEAQLIGLQRGKSDRDYERELSRRARTRPGLISVFTANLSLFERAWYGMYDVDLATIRQFEANLEQLRTRAEQ